MLIFDISQHTIGPIPISHAHWVQADMPSMNIDKYKTDIVWGSMLIIYCGTLSKSAKRYDNLATNYVPARFREICLYGPF